MTPCFPVRSRLASGFKHMEPLSQLLYWLPRMSSNVSAPIFGVMIRSFGQMGDVDQVRELWKQMTARGLQPGLTFGCMAEALALNGQPDEALELIHSHANSEEARPCINPVTYTTDLKASPIPSVPRRSSARMRK